MTTGHLTADDSKRIDFLSDLFRAHLTLTDPNDSEGARWVIDEAVRLAKQYWFDDPETVGVVLAESIL